MAEFDAWAWVYDRVHTGLQGEAQYYINEANHAGGPVLELGVGSGRIAIPIAIAGTDIVGLDISLPMLELCRSNMDRSQLLEGDLTLVHADMRYFRLEKQFALIIAPYRSFMHLTSWDDQLSAMLSIADHLVEGGQFIMNTWIPPLEYQLRFSAEHGEEGFLPVNTYRNEDSSEIIEHCCKAQCVRSAQRILEHHQLTVKDAESMVVAHHELRLSRRWTTVEEMGHLAAASELHMLDVYDGFHKKPYSGRNEAVCVFQKPVNG